MYINRSPLQFIIQRYNNNSRVFHAFNAFWETGFDGNVRVYKSSMDYWRANNLVDTPEFNRFIKSLGMNRKDLDEDIDAGRDYDEIDRIYFKLKRHSERSVELSNEEIALMINSLSSEIKISIGTSDGNKFVNSEGVFDEELFQQDLQKDVLQQYLHSYRITIDNYGEFVLEPQLGVAKYTVVKNEDEYINTNNMFAILFPNIFEIKEVTSITTFLNTEKSMVYTHKFNKDDLSEEYKDALASSGNFSINEVQQPNHNTTFNRKSDIVANIQLVLSRKGDATAADCQFLNNWFKAMRDKFLFSRSYIVYEDEFRIKLPNYKPNFFDAMADRLEMVHPPLNDAFWYKRRLRVSAFHKIKNPIAGEIITPIASHPRKEFMKILNKSFTTGYKVKKAEWWEIAIAVVVIIAAIIATVLTFGAAAGITAPVAATTLAMLSATVVIGSIALAKYGGRSALGLSKIVGEVVMWTGVVNAVAGIINYMSNLASKEAVKQAASQTTAEATKVAAPQITVQTILDNIKDYISTPFKSLSSFGSSLKNLYANLSKLNNAYSLLKKVTAKTPDASTIEDFADDTDNERIVFAQEQFEQLSKIDTMYAEIYEYSKFTRTNERKSMV